MNFGCIHDPFEEQRHEPMLFDLQISPEAFKNLSRVWLSFFFTLSVEGRSDYSPPSTPQKDGVFIFTYKFFGLREGWAEVSRRVRDEGGVGRLAPNCHGNRKPRGRVAGSGLLG